MPNSHGFLPIAPLVYGCQPGPNHGSCSSQSRATGSSRHFRYGGERIVRELMLITSVKWLSPVSADIGRQRVVNHLKCFALLPRSALIILWLLTSAASN